MLLSRGQRLKISDLSISNNFKIKIYTENCNNIEFDISCFGLDENNICSDDRYMIFYNQKISPCNSIILSDQTSTSALFDINLSKIPEKINKLVFTMTIDGNQKMSDLNTGYFNIVTNGDVKVSYVFKGSDFDKEKSIMVAEIYKKNEWRLSAVGHGFNGGLSALLEHFGIEEEKEDNNTLEVIVENTSNSNINIEEKKPKNTFTGFIKNILSAPFKYNEEKQKQKDIERQKQLDEINKNNNKIRVLGEFKNLLIDALSDGVLTKEEMSSLEKYCLSNNLNLNDCLSYSKYEIENFLHVMLADIVSDHSVTKEEEEAINSVCRFLNPSYILKQEIDETIRRVKFIENIKAGNVQPITNHSIQTKIDEIVWFINQDIRLVRELKKEVKYHLGDMYVTSERIIFKSYEYPVEILNRNILDIEVDGSHLFINGKNTKSTFRFRLNNGEILGAYIDQALNKFHRKLNLNQTAKNTRSISQDVKQAVWIRDMGQCVQCSSNQYLEFDHIIPYSKGGSNSINNIQLLCRKCNLTKSDNI